MAKKEISNFFLILQDIKTYFKHDERVHFFEWLKPTFRDLRSLTRASEGTDQKIFTNLNLLTDDTSESLRNYLRVTQELPQSYSRIISEPLKHHHRFTLNASTPLGLNHIELIKIWIIFYYNKLKGKKIWSHLNCYSICGGRVNAWLFQK